MCENKKIFKIVVETEKKINVSLARFFYNDLKGVQQRFVFIY